MSRYDWTTDLIAMQVETDPVFAAECMAASKLYSDAYEMSHWLGRRVTPMLWKQGAKLDGFALQFFAGAVQNLETYYLRSWVEERYYAERTAAKAAAKAEAEAAEAKAKEESETLTSLLSLADE